MKPRMIIVSLAIALVSVPIVLEVVSADPVRRASVGPRPFYLIDEMEDSRLKSRLEACARRPMLPHDWSIGHRGSPLLFPEHTAESYVAAARMGAGIIECDVTFTKDGELVCRHAQCDLHTTTNILATPLAEKCTRGPDFSSNTPFANVRCCTSDITLAEFKSLCGKMDAGNRNAQTVEEYLNSTANWRTDLYSSTCGEGENFETNLLTHAESIELIREYGGKFTPEAKSPEIPMPADTNGDGVPDFSQEDYIQKVVDEYKDASVPPEDVWLQSFNLSDVLYWVNNEPAFGEQAVYLDNRTYNTAGFDQDDEATWAGPTMQELVDLGVNILAPHMSPLLTLNGSNEIIPSLYAIRAKEAGLDIITWTTERSGRIVEEVLEGNSTFYYSTTLDGLSGDGDIMTTLHVLAQDVGVIGVFSDWPGTTTYYANCLVR